MNRYRLLKRFLKYVDVHTTAIENAGVYPSSRGQFKLGKILRDELHEMGITNAEQDENGIVLATIPSNVDHKTPVIGFNSHVDTSPETSGENVKPNVIESYEGGDIILSGDPTKVIRVSDNPELNDLHGKTIITTDGTTLLGGDDKAGLAIIMEFAENLMENPDLPHGEVRLLFTCDEEIGHGVDHVDLEKVSATACYTLDGGGHGMVDVETFSADLCVVKVRGVNIHPSIAKNRMVNALRAAGDFLSNLPTDAAPETTEGREGFIHPYVLEGGVAEVTIKILFRDFDTGKLPEKLDVVKFIAAKTEQKFPGVSFTVESKPQYRNMADGLKKEPRAVDFAVKAHENLGLDVKQTIIRGGTDGSQLTEKGLPTPNLSSGQHNPHSPLEWACLDEMLQACNVITEITKLWSEEKA